MLSSSNFWSIDFIQKILLTVPNACVAAVFGWLAFRIAREQKNIQKEKIISDLFDRRFSVYLSIRNCLVNIIINNDMDLLKENISVAVDNSHVSRFLFQRSTYTKIDSLIQDIVKYQTFTLSRRKRIRLDEDESELDIEIKNELSRISMSCVNLLRGGLEEIFDPYLSIRDFRNDGQAATK